jgi:hypothetical protein
VLVRVRACACVCVCVYVCVLVRERTAVHAINKHALQRSFSQNQPGVGARQRTQHPKPYTLNPIKPSRRALCNTHAYGVTKGMLEEHGLATVPGSFSVPAGRKSAVKTVTKAPLSARRGSTR